MKISKFVVSLALATMSLGSRHAGAQEEPVEPIAAQAPPPVLPVEAEKRDALKLTPMGYLEVYYQYNFNRPSNGITNYRGFDSRHNTFTVSNAALGGTVEKGPLSARLVLQVGSAPSTYYAGEPVLAGAAGANASGPELWKYLQEAWISYKAPVGHGLLIQAGLFLSPIGPEVVPVKDNWNWSRSNLFFGLPFYHTGVHATYELTDKWSATVGIYNGWNSVVDNNEAKSVEGHVIYKADKVLAQLLYFGGVERSAGSPEGPYWRNDFDAYAQIDFTKQLSGLAHVNAGWEPTRFGTSDWFAGALAARLKAFEFLYFAARGDRFHEGVASNSLGTAAPLFWGGVKWVSSATATIDVRPLDTISIRLEYRHDQAQGDLYFRSNVAGNGSPAAPFIANARSQDTVTLGTTVWF